MALIPSDLDKLKKGAINYLYIFIDPNAKGLAPIVMQKRNEQIAALKKIYSYNTGYTFADMVQIIQVGIQQRYSKTPAQLLQKIYETAVGNPSVGDATTDAIKEQAAIKVHNLTTSVSEGGVTKTSNFWTDAKSVIEWLVEIFTKLFGSKYTNPTVYSPDSDHWTYDNQPSESGLSSAGFGVLPMLVVGGVLYTLYSTTQKKGKKKKDN